MNDLDLKGIDVLCKEGVSFSFYEKVESWLRESEGRRLFFIEDDAQRLKVEAAKTLLNDPCVKIFFLESPIQKEFIAKKIGWLSAFKELKIIGESWRELIQMYHIAAHAIASDAADFGASVMRHLKINHRKKVLWPI